MAAKNWENMVRRHLVCVPINAVLNVNKKTYKDEQAIILEAKPTILEARKAAKRRRENAGPDSIHQFCFARTIVCDKAAMIPLRIGKRK